MPTTSALIGYTGFVGGNLRNQHPFEYLYNSKNIGEIQGKQFELAVCAGASGIKWLANKEPKNDLIAIEKLIENLKTIKTKKFILISTIDVYSSTIETNELSTIDKDKLAPYGKHRRMLEEFVETNFDSLIVRLPGLFGTGLKKNIIYDLIHKSYAFVNPKSTLQFYYLQNLWKDITKAMENHLKIVNLVSEPIIIADIAKNVFHIDLPSKDGDLPANYDIYSQYANLWSNSKHYLYSKESVLDDLQNFIKTT